MQVAANVCACAQVETPPSGLAKPPLCESSSCEGRLGTTWISFPCEAQFSSVDRGKTLLHPEAKVNAPSMSHSDLRTPKLGRKF